jgi:hypothetical protein
MDNGEHEEWTAFDTKSSRRRQRTNQKVFERWDDPEGVRRLAESFEQFQLDKPRTPRGSSNKWFDREGNVVLSRRSVAAGGWRADSGLMRLLCGDLLTPLLQKLPLYLVEQLSSTNRTLRMALMPYLHEEYPHYDPETIVYHYFQHIAPQIEEGFKTTLGGFPRFRYELRGMDESSSNSCLVIQVHGIQRFVTALSLCHVNIKYNNKFEWRIRAEFFANTRQHVRDFTSSLLSERTQFRRGIVIDFGPAADASENRGFLTGMGIIHNVYDDSRAMTLFPVKTYSDGIVNYLITWIHRNFRAHV